MLEIRLLGELEVARGGRPVALPASKKSRALLGFLVATGKPQLREALCDLLWAGPDDPRAALRWSLTKIRALVDDGKARRLTADRERVAFEPGGASVDLACVRELVGADATSASTASLRAAAGLFRGELLEGLDLPDCYRYREWCVAEREAARSLRVAVLSALVARLSDTPEEALGFARAHVAIDPLSEAAHVEVVMLLARLGKRQAALAQYETCARILALELGTKPSPRLVAARALIGAASSTSSPSPPAGPAPLRPPAEEPVVGSARSARLPVVGRVAERALIAEGIEGAVGSARARPPVLLFVGAPGIGKTRLLEVLAEQTRDKGGVVVAGRAFELEKVRPYGPWVDALRSAPLGEAVDAVRGDLVALLPELGGTAGPNADRSHFFGAVVKVLERMAGGRPVALVLDDVHWLDEASAALLHHVARNAPAGLVIACGARPAELTDNQPVQRLVRALARDGMLVERELSPLDEAETALLVSACGGVDPTRVFAESRGHPYFAVQIAEALARGDDVLPDSLAKMIDDQLERLGPAGRGLVPWVAALSRGFDLELLARAGGLSPTALMSAVEELEHQRILKVTAGASGAAGYDFVHDLVRERAYRQVSEPRRRLIHLQIARALAAAESPEGHASGEVAHHAALAGDHELAARASLAGARRALQVFANEEAARLARFGGEHAEGLAPHVRLPLQVDLLHVLMLSNMWRSRAEEVEEELRRRIDECERVGLRDAAAAGLYALGTLQYESGKRDSAGQSMLRALDEASEGEPVARALKLAFVGRCLSLLERDMARAKALLEEARTLAGAKADDLIELIWGVGTFERYSGNLPAAVAALERALALARRAQSRWTEFDCLLQLTLIDLQQGRPREALARCADLAAIGSKMTGGSEGTLAAALEALARAEVAGDPDASSLAVATEGLKMADSKGALTFVLTQTALLELSVGRLAAARAHADEAARAADAVKKRSDAALARVALGFVALAEGDPDEARRQLSGAGEGLGLPLALSAYAGVRVRALAAKLEVDISTLGETPSTTTAVHASSGAPRLSRRRGAR